MAYKFQKGAFHADGLISGSSTVKAVGSLSSSGDIALTGALHVGGILYGDGSGITGVSAGPAGADKQVQYNDGGSMGGDSAFTFNDSTKVVSFTGLVSGSGGAQLIGASASFDGINVSGGIEATGSIHGGELSGTADVIAGDGGNTGFISRRGMLLGWDGAQDGKLQFLADANSLSGSGTVEIVGASVFVGAMKMSGTVRMEQGNSLSFNGSSNTAKITNQGQNLDINAPGAIVFNAATFVSSGVGAQFVGNSIFGGNLDVSGNLAVGDSASDTMQVKATAVFAGPLGYKLGTITTNSELTASSDRSYQIVSGGTSGITLTMPSASNTNYSYMIKRHSLMSGNVVITGSGGDAASQLIDGNASITLSTVGASVFLIADGTQWNIF